MQTWRLAHAPTMNEAQLRDYIWELSYALAEARDVLGKIPWVHLEEME